jgi:inorganic triphosphatase YgiF
MDVRVISKATDFNRRQTVAVERCLRPTFLSSCGARGVFKKSRSAADLQRPGRDLAKDNGETGFIASLTKSLDQSDRFEAVFSARSRISAESIRAVLGTSHHRLMLVGRAARPLQFVADGTSALPADCSDPININLTAVAGNVHPTARMLRQTNNLSGWLCKAAQQVGSAIDGVVTHSGGSHEKYGYAGV